MFGCIQISLTWRERIKERNEKTSQTSNRGSWNHKTDSGCVVIQQDFVFFSFISYIFIFVISLTKTTASLSLSSITLSFPSVSVSVSARATPLSHVQVWSLKAKLLYFCCFWALVPIFEHEPPADTVPYEPIPTATTSTSSSTSSTIITSSSCATTNTAHFLNPNAPSIVSFIFYLSFSFFVLYHYTLNLFYYHFHFS